MAACADAIFAGWAGASGPGCSPGVNRVGRLIHATGHGGAILDHGVPNRSAAIGMGAVRPLDAGCSRLSLAR